MRSLSQVMLLGHLAADPESRQTKTGKSVTSFPVATNRNRVTDNGEKSEVADFHRIVAWGSLADICSKYLRKGMPVLVIGRLVNRSFDDKDGNRHYRTEVIADSLNMLTWRKGKSGKGEIGVQELKKNSEEVAEDVPEKEAVAA